MLIGNVSKVEYKLSVDIHSQDLHKRLKGSIEESGSVGAAEAAEVSVIITALL